MTIQQKLDSYRTCFDESPLAFCIIQVICDEKDISQDMAFIYANKALAELEDTSLEYLQGKHLDAFFEDINTGYPGFFVKIAYEGTANSLVGFNSIIEKHLQLDCHQVEKGYVACFLRDVSNRVKMEAKLNEETQKYQALVENMPGGVGVFELTETATRIAYCSDSFYGFAGYTREELEEPCSKNAFFRVYSEDKPLLEKAQKDVLEGASSVDITYRINRKEGGTSYVNLKASLMERNQDKTTMYGVYTDVDEQIHSEQCLEMEATKYQTLVESIPGGVGIYVVDEKFTPIYVSDVTCELCGFTREEYEEAIAESAIAVFHPDDIADGIHEIQEALAENRSFTYTYRLLQKNGSYRWSRLWGNRMPEDHLGYPVVCVVFLDVDEQVRTEKSLHAKEQMYKIAAKNSNVNMWEYDIKTKVLYQTETSIEVHPSFDAVIYDFPESVIRSGHLRPDCIPLYRKLCEDVSNGKPTSQGDIWFKNHDGEGWWCEHVTYINIYNDDGSVLRTIGVGRNITEEINTKTEKQKMDTILHNADLYLWEYDITNSTITWQERGMRDFNMPKISSNAPYSVVESGLIHSDSAEKFLHLHVGVKNGEPFVMEEIRIILPNKEERWQKISYNTIFDNNGDAVRAVGCAVEITAMKAMERQFQDEMHYLEAVQGEKLLAKGRGNITQDIFESFVTEEGFLVFQPGDPYTVATDTIISTVVDEESRAEVAYMFQRERVLKDFAEGEKHYEVEYQRRLRDGRILWVKTTIKAFQYPSTGDIMCFIYTHNIDDEKTVQIMMEQVVNLNYDYIAKLDVLCDKYTIYAKTSEDTPLPPKFAENYEEQVAIFARKHMHEEDIERNIQEMSYANVMKMLEDREVYTTYSRVKNFDGSIGQKKLQFTYMDAKNKTIILTRTDVTDIIAKEEQQREILRNALGQAEEASRAKSDFLSRMSHEIRTPMNAIIGMSTLATQYINNPTEVSDCISKVGISARYLLTLINDILDMSRIESGKVTVKHEKIPFEEFIHSINTICYEQAQENGVEYDTIMSSFTEDYYFGDAMKLQQVLINLISNAIKFTQSGGKVQFMVHQDKIRNGKAHMRFVVKDTGIGISEGFLPKLFDPFEQENSGITTIYGGTGLGLAICKNLVALMGGNITVNSIVGVGSEFTVTIALDLCEESLKRVKNNNELNFEMLSALIVDDETIICQQTQSILSKMGVRAEWVESGTKAVDIVKKQWAKHCYYDVILVDWKMPDMNGIETTKEIRRIVGSDVTIIIMTAYDWFIIEEEAKKAGVNYFISKPVFKSSLSSAFEKFYVDKEEKKQELIPREFDFTGKHVLLVEDHVLNVEVAKRLLEAKGLTVDVAENGLDAIEAFVTSAPFYYDMILMDIRMPLMDGLTATKSIRHMKKADAKTIPIIAMSANAFDEDVEESKAAGLNAHLAKPIDAQLLYGTIQEFLSDK